MKIATDDMTNDLVRKQQTLKKPNPEIGFRITAGEMTFLGRKIYNALVYRAQQLGHAGKGQLPFPLHYDLGELIPYEKYWWTPLSNIISDASTGPRKHAMVCKYLRGLMGVVVERNVVGWEACHIISTARIIGTRDPKGAGKGDQLIVGWRFPEEIEDKLLEPDQYTRLSLYFQSLLKTESALVLYEICKRYSTSPGHLTPRLEWQEWQARLTSDRTRSEYKFFKRDFVLPAIKEVCAWTDIDVELIEHRAPLRGAPIESIQFSAKQKAQTSLEFTPGPAVPCELLTQMEEMGVSTMQAEKYLAQYGEEKIRAAIEHTIERVSNIHLPPLAVPAAYFKKAMLEDFAGGARNALASKAKKTIEGNNARAKLLAQSSQETSSQLEVDIPSGEDLLLAWADFRISPQAKLLFKNLPNSYEEAGQRERGVFSGFLATRA